MKKRIFAIVMSVSLLVCAFALNVQAEEPSANNQISFEEYQSMFDDFKANGSSLISNPELKPSEFFEKMDNLDNNVFNRLAWELPTNITSATQLNMEYTSLLKDMKGLGFGTKTELEIPTFKAGYSTDLASKFKDQFGDIKNTPSVDISIPDGLSMGSIMKDASAERDAQFGAFMESDTYKNVLETVSIGDCFANAEKTLKLKNLKDNDSLKELLDPLYDDAFTEWRGDKYDDNAFIENMISAGYVDSAKGEFSDLSDLYKGMVDENRLTVNYYYDSPSDMLWEGTDGFNNSYGMGTLINYILAPEYLKPALKEALQGHPDFNALDDGVWWPGDGIVHYDLSDVFGTAAWGD